MHLGKKKRKEDRRDKKMRVEVSVRGRLVMAGWLKEAG